MIEGVTFDWWNTLAMTTPEQDARLRDIRIARLKALLDRTPGRERAFNEAKLREAYDLQTDRLRETWARNVDLSPSEQTGIFLHVAGLDGGAESFSEAVSEAFGSALLELPPALFPHAIETLDWLKRNGYAVGLISNTGRTWGRFLREVQDRLGIGKYFDVRIFSDEVRIRKPEAGIFEKALQGLHLPPEKVAHIGDDVDADVAGAKAYGMRAVWFNAGRLGHRPGDGRWADTAAEKMDAEVRDHAETPALLRRWRE